MTERQQVKGYIKESLKKEVVFYFSLCPVDSTRSHISQTVNLFRLCFKNNTFLWILSFLINITYKRHVQKPTSSGPTEKSIPIQESSFCHYHFHWKLQELPKNNIMTSNSLRTATSEPTNIDSFEYKQLKSEKINRGVPLELIRKLQRAGSFRVAILPGIAPSKRPKLRNELPSSSRPSEQPPKQHEQAKPTIKRDKQARGKTDCRSRGNTERHAYVLEESLVSVDNQNLGRLRVGQQLKIGVRQIHLRVFLSPTNSLK